MATGTLSQLDEEQLRLEAELESVWRELDACRNTNSKAMNYSRLSHQSIVQPSSLICHPVQCCHSDSSLDNFHHSRKRQPHKHRGDSIDYDMGGENPIYGTHMMQVLLEQQARVYSKENQILWKNGQFKRL